MTDTSILIVDDHELVRRGLRSMLRDVEDLNIVGRAGTGKEALKKARELRPNVAIVDLGLPDMTGLQLIRELNRSYDATGVVVLSIHADEAYVGEALRAGAMGYVVKDAPSAELIRAVRSVAKGMRFLSSSLDQSQLDRYQPGEPNPERSFALLTPREKEILLCIAEGLKSAQVGERLAIAKRTVDSHRSNITEKLDIKTAADLTRYAVHNKLLTQPQSRSRRR